MCNGSGAALLNSILSVLWRYLVSYLIIYRQFFPVFYCWEFALTVSLYHRAKKHLGVLTLSQLSWEELSCDDQYRGEKFGPLSAHYITQQIWWNGIKLRIAENRTRLVGVLFECLQLLHFYFVFCNCVSVLGLCHFSSNIACVCKMNWYFKLYVFSQTWSECLFPNNIQVKSPMHCCSWNSRAWR